MILRMGSEIVEVVRVGRLIERYQERFLTRIFTHEEICFCRHRVEYLQHFAGFWSIKAAVAKGLGVGQLQGMRWKDIIIEPLPTGQFFIQLRGALRDFAEPLEISRWFVTMAHCHTYATATVIAWHDEPGAFEFD